MSKYGENIGKRITEQLKLRILDAEAMRLWVKKWPVTDPHEREQCVILNICPDCGAKLRGHRGKCPHEA
jgi:hypothetical protein